MVLSSCFIASQAAAPTATTARERKIMLAPELPEACVEIGRFRLKRFRIKQEAKQRQAPAGTLSSFLVLPPPPGLRQLTTS